MKNSVWLTAIFLLFFVSFALAGTFPEIGKSYQINRAKYPEKVAVCGTKESMTDYMEALLNKNVSKSFKLVHEVKTNKDIEDLRASGECTLISSFSQAKVLKKGIEVHQAEFAAFPFLPMWGYHDYFGAPMP